MKLRERKLGWVGTGRMGYALAARLLDAGCDLTVYNRTRAKAEPLVERGARVVDAPVELADRDIVFTMVAGPEDFKEVLLGERGLLTADGTTPGTIVDATTVSPEASAAVRAEAAAKPAKVPYLYYVVKPCGDGAHAFSSTEEGFERDYRRYHEARASRGKSPSKC